MADTDHAFPLAPHDHVFLGRDHDTAERRTWAVIVLCSVMMVAEIVGGALFGSLALIADGLHMSTHAGALLLAALAYTYARKYAYDRSFTFGTGKFGDLAAFSSALILAIIAEMAMGGYGLGGAMMSASRFADSRGVFAGIVEIAIVGYALIKAMALIRRRLLVWHQESAEQH